MRPIVAGEATAFRLLTRLFVRRLVDNDLISPHADRHESLAVAYALVVSLAVFATFFLCTNYLAAFIQLPGPAALSALSDRFLFIAASVTTSALAALMVWDALALEPRDAAVLGPLPIPARTITRAKLAAVMLFGTALTLALNAVPSVLYPAFLTLNIRGTRGVTILRLMAAHAITVTTAGVFGFFGVLAIRGALRLLLGETIFRRMSSGIQSALVVIMVTALLLAPTVRAGQVRAWVSGAADSRWVARPALWYLGMNETLAGYLVADTPIVLPPRLSAVGFRRQGDEAAKAMYRALRPPFAALARRAWLSLLLTTAVALATFLWTNRRLPERSVAASSASRLGAIVRRIAERCTEHDPEAQAGFFFALQTLTRSSPHRTIMSIAIAVGLTHALIVLAQIDGWPHGGAAPVGALAITVMLLTTLLAGIAYGVTVPAELAANWTIRTAWLGDERRYLAGVKRAAMFLSAVLLMVLAPVHVALLGLGHAAVHSLYGLLFAAVAADVLMLSYRKLPFACSYVPIANPKLAWPAGFATLLLVTYGFAAIERSALQTGPGGVAFAMGLGAIVAAVRQLDAARRRERRPVEFQRRPAAATQQLGLLEHITIQD